MTAAKQLIDHKLLRSLSPLCDLTPDMLTELSAKSRVEQVPSGVTIFKAGERDHRTLYLISGKLQLTDATGRTTKMAANSQQARQPLDPVMPRSITVISSTPVTLLNIDTSLLEMLTNWGRNQSYEVSSLDVSEEEETDWMSRFLQSKVFLKLRAENIQAMMMRMEEIEMRANDIVIKQGDHDENYYIISKGKAQVARRATPDAPMMKLAVLTAGNGFGEEALIGNSERNASVIMMEDGKLMRLSKQDFIELLVEPVMQYLTYDEAKALGESGVEWLDVRKLDEYSSGTLPGAKNTPVTELRLSLRKFNKLHKYIVFSDTDDRAAAAVFLLNQYGLDAYVLRNALANVKKVIPPKPKQQPAPAPTPASKPTPAKETAKNEDNANNVVALHGEKPSGGEGQIAAMMNSARKRVEQEMKRADATELARKKAQEEVARLKAEVEASRKRMEEEARRATTQAKTDVEKAALQKRNEEVAREQAEREEVLKRAEAEAARAKMAEAAKDAAEAEIERLKKQAAKAQQVSLRAQAAESEVEQLKQQAEAARREAATQAKLAADEAQTKAERKIAAQRAKEMERLQAEREEMARRAEVEASRAHIAEKAQRKAEAEIQRLKVDAEVARMQVEEQAQRVADAARSDAEREAARAQAAEEARLQAEEELERLAARSEQIRLEAEEQARMAADAARSEAEREASLLRAEELADQQRQLGEIAQRAEEEAERARMADEARQRAESEIARKQQQAEEAARRAEEEARRAWEAEDARRKMEQEMAQLRAEAAAAKAVMEEQARQFAAAQRGVEEEKARKEAERQEREEAERKRLEDEEAENRRKQADELARKAAEEAKRAKVEAENLRKQSEEEILKLRAEAEAARIRAEIEVKRSLAAARREVDENAAKQKAKARLEVTKNKDDSANDRARRARAARAAALEAMGDDGSMEEIFGVGYKNEATVARDVVTDSPPPKDGTLDNDNLIDPTEVMKVDAEEKKRAWVSDDLAWEAAVGYRKDEDVERYDSSSADSLTEKITSRQAPKADPEPVVEVVSEPEIKSQAKVKPETNSEIIVEPGVVKSKFEAQEIDRTIRPQTVTPSASKVRVGTGISKVKIIVAGLVVLVAVAAGGWFYSKQASAPRELKQVVATSTNQIKEVVDKSTESLGQLKDKIAEKIQQLKSGLTGKDKEVTEEELANLRERLQKLKDESARSAKKLAKERKATARKRVKASAAAAKPARAKEKKPVIKAQKVVKKEVVKDTSQQSQNTVGDPKVVDSVDSLPVIGTTTEKQAAAP